MPSFGGKGLDNSSSNGSNSSSSISMAHSMRKNMQQWRRLTGKECSGRQPHFRTKCCSMATAGRCSPSCRWVARTLNPKSFLHVCLQQRNPGSDSKVGTPSPQKLCCSTPEPLLKNPSITSQLDFISIHSNLSASADWNQGFRTLLDVDVRRGGAGAISCICTGQHMLVTLGGKVFFSF